MKKFINVVNFMMLVLVSILMNNSVRAGSGKSWGLFGGGVATGIVGTKLFSSRNRRYHEPERVVVREVQTVPVQQATVPDTSQWQQLQAQLNQQSAQIQQQQNLIAELRADLKEERDRYHRLLESKK
jgi:hypothetical protein